MSRPKFKKGDKVYWMDPFAGDDAWGIVTNVWKDAIVGWVMYVDLRGTSPCYPLVVEDDVPSLKPYHQPVDAGPATL